MNFCHQCGSKLLGQENFCAECGENTRDAPATLSSTSKELEEPDEQTNGPIPAPVAESAPMEMRNCPACGRLHEADASFCAHCGAAITANRSEEGEGDKPDSLGAEGFLASLTGAGCGCGCLLPAALILILLLFGTIGIFL